MISVQLALHVLGAVGWIGGLAGAGLTVLFADGNNRKAAAAAARRTVLYLATPGMLLSWVVGLWMLIPAFGDVYAKQGWMHGKLTIALVVTGLTGFLTGRLRKAGVGEADASSRFLGGMIAAVLVLATIVVFLVKLRPGS